MNWNATPGFPWVARFPLGCQVSLGLPDFKLLIEYSLRLTCFFSAEDGVTDEEEEETSEPEKKTRKEKKQVLIDLQSCAQQQQYQCTQDKFLMHSGQSLNALRTKYQCTQDKISMHSGQSLNALRTKS